MPIARIEVKRGWPPEKQQFLIEATHAAMVDALKIPEYDRLIRFVEHRPEHGTPGASENYTLVEIPLFPGRSLDAKRNLYQGIVKRCAPGIAKRWRVVRGRHGADGRSRRPFSAVKPYMDPSRLQEVLRLSGR